MLFFLKKLNEKFPIQYLQIYKLKLKLSTSYLIKRFFLMF